VSDIFLSYAHEDLPRVKRLAMALEANGWSVWWGDGQVKSGQHFDAVIENEINQASCVLVLWTKASVNSLWTRTEASEALRRYVLIPIFLDAVKPPLEFSNLHGLDLSSWSGEYDSEEFQRLLLAIKGMLSGLRETVTKARTGDTTGSLISAKESGVKCLREIKVLFVGDGGSGKSSLLRHLVQKPFDSDQQQTHGIDIVQRSIKQSGNDIQLNLWDFGGQEIMHSTHQFFLSQRSFYVLVLDGRKEEDPEYWLHLIDTFGGKSPVLVVLNKIDEHPAFDVNRKFLREKYQTIREFCRLSCRTSEGFDDFFAALKREIANCEHINTEWPADWYRVKVRLEELDNDYISYERYADICRNEGLTDDDAIESLANFLNDIGTVVHFDEPVLRETNVVNPTWITSAVYGILTSKALADGHGVLGRSSLPKILDKSRFPKHRHDYVIELMKRFELCFSIDDDRILVPDLLQVTEPSFEFNTLNALRYRIEYDFFPTSIMPRLLVNLHSDIHDRLLWRTGCVLHEPTFGVRALLRADQRDKSIQVFVTGVERREYFSIIRKALLDINRSLHGLKFNEKIPCICPDCRASTRAYFFDYRYLIQRKIKGKKTVDCEHSVESVLLDQLLSGIESPDAPPDGWDVFVSYSSSDAETVRAVVADLEKRQVRVWWDRGQITPGDSISKQIELGLRRSRFVMPCVSRNQISSGWCRAEYAGALSKILSGYTPQKVTPLILDDLDDSELPYLLSDFRVERRSDPIGYGHLLSFLSGR
jgi:small GTP-binding protein